MRINLDNIELTPCKINNSAEVNPWPMDDVQVQLVNDELIIYMRGTVGPKGELPGALVGFTLPVINTVLDMPMVFSGLNYEVKSDEASLAIIDCLETDLKWCIEPAPDSNNPIPNIMGGDAQKNKGVWEIYNDWTGKTGFEPAPFIANQWNKVAMRHSIKPALGEFSFDSISDGGEIYVVQPALRNKPLVKSNWRDTGLQLQICFGRTGYATVAFRNISAVFSNLPIPTII